MKNYKRDELYKAFLADDLIREKKTLKERWEQYQSENDEKMKWNIDIKSIVIALGWAVLWLGIGIVGFCWYFNIFNSQYPI